METINTVERENVVLSNYLKEYDEVLRVKKVNEANADYYFSERCTLRKGLNLGRLISEGLNNFNDPINKQLRKELGLKISAHYFIEKAYLLKKSWAYELKEAYELGTEVHNKYLNSGNLEHELTIKGLLRFVKPKKEETTEESTEESTEETTEETTEESTTKTIKIGAITINIGEASNDDILKAIEYLQNLAK